MYAGAQVLPSLAVLFPHITVFAPTAFFSSPLFTDSNVHGKMTCALKAGCQTSQNRGKLPLTSARVAASCD